VARRFIVDRLGPTSDSCTVGDRLPGTGAVIPVSGDERRDI
jgi:hypothetical protein